MLLIWGWHYIHVRKTVKISKKGLQIINLACKHTNRDVP